ncbi:MAG: tetratricopeptide repeat protein [Chitinophagaceae bacterium]
MQAINKKAILMMAIATTLGFGSAAQSLDEGIKMVKYERFNSAEKILQPLAASNPVANYYLGIAELGEGNKTQAQTTFQKFPDDAANKAGMARMAYESGNATEGDKLTKEITDKAKKKDWEAYAFAADAVNYGGGNPQDAVKYYDEAIKRGGDNVAIHIGLGDAYQRIQGGGGKAMDNYEAAVAKDPKNSLGFSRIGKLWYDAHNYTDALTNYQKAKDADPTNPLPYSDLANVYFYVSKYELAKQNIEQYLKLSDQSCDDKIRYANILFLAKYYPDAINKMNEVLDKCGQKPYMYRVLGYSQYETKDYPEALKNMQTFFVKQTDPKKILPSDYMYLGRIYGAEKMPDSSDYYYLKAISVDTAIDKSATYNEIAENYKAMNTQEGYTASAKYYKMALDAKGAKASALDYFNYGLMAYYSKQYDAAAKTFEDMETKFPDQPSATYWRARVAAAVDNEGKTGAAVPLFEKWLAIPNYEHKSSDLNLAYQYLAIVAYNKNDKKTTMDYVAKIRSIEPDNALAKQLDELMNKPAKTKK